MKRRRIFVSSLCAVSLLSLSACVTDPNTGQQKVSRTAIGAGGGALVGLLIGGLIGGRTGRIIGAGIGGIAGGAVGYTMDKQIKRLRAQTAASGADVRPTDNGAAILVNLPEGVTPDSDSTLIKPAARDALDRVAQSMVQYPDSLIDVYGHTDSTGSDAYNQALSENRARGGRLSDLARRIGAARAQPRIWRNAAGGLELHRRRPQAQPPDRDQDRAGHAA